MTTTTYPVRVDASPEPDLSRGLWLVKWILVLPHYVVLAFLWVAFGVLSVLAFFAIAVTGRYPRRIFDFNVGVLRWSWRVAYYSYGALATDRYPPFTLADVRDYPAHLEIAYPEHLSRGLVWVKWWLLALPHYVVVSLLAGGGFFLAGSASDGEASWTWGGGLIGILVLVGAVVLLVTGRFPPPILDLVLGLNRWVLRVAAYAALMTDDYPPFRLDMGPRDPGTLVGTAPPAVVDPTGPAHTQGTEHWSAGRTVTMVMGCLTLVAAGGLLAAGSTLAVLQATVQDDGGFSMSREAELGTTTYALTSANLETRIGDGAAFVPEQLLGDTMISVTAPGAEAVFVGIAPTDRVDAYLADVEHTVVVDFDTIGSDRGPVYADERGQAPATAPADALRWSAQASGTGTQDLVWALEDGDWTVVVMNADGSAEVAVDVAVGAELPAMWWVVAMLSVLGALLLALSAGLIWAALRARTVRP